MIIARFLKNPYSYVFRKDLLHYARNIWTYGPEIYGYNINHKTERIIRQASMVVLPNLTGRIINKNVVATYTLCVNTNVRHSIFVSRARNIIQNGT